MIYRYDKDELVSCILSLEIMCENLSNFDLEKGDIKSSQYHQYMSQALHHIYLILKH